MSDVGIGAILLAGFPKRGAARSGAPLIRDRRALGDFCDPYSAAHHFELRCAREAQFSDLTKWICADYPPKLRP
jgi:hypothetical protein